MLHTAKAFDPSKPEIDIVHEKKRFWNEPGHFYHSELAAGEVRLYDCPAAWGVHWVCRCLTGMSIGHAHGGTQPIVAAVHS